MLSLVAILFFGPYMADLVEVKDGDTVVMDVHVWPGQINRIAIREFGVDTPEKRTRNLCEKELGIKATNFTKEFLQNKILLVTNLKEGKYAGRMLGTIVADGEELSTALISNGHGREYFGGRRQQWCEEESLILDGFFRYSSL